MKKLILVMLILMVCFTPCPAQVIKPGGLFSIEGTLWLVVMGTAGYYIGFSDGEIYIGNSKTDIEPISIRFEKRGLKDIFWFYIDSPLQSIYYYQGASEEVAFHNFGTLFSWFPSELIELINPPYAEFSGIGFEIMCIRPSDPSYLPFFHVLTAYKEDDNWTPPID